VLGESHRGHLSGFICCTSDGWDGGEPEPLWVGVGLELDSLRVSRCVGVFSDDDIVCSYLRTHSTKRLHGWLRGGG